MSAGTNGAAGRTGARRSCQREGASSERKRTSLPRREDEGGGQGRAGQRRGEGEAKARRAKPPLRWLFHRVYSGYVPRPRHLSSLSVPACPEPRARRKMQALSRYLGRRAGGAGCEVPLAAAYCRGIRYGGGRLRAGRVRDAQLPGRRDRTGHGDALYVHALPCADARGWPHAQPTAAAARLLLHGAQPLSSCGRRTGRRQPAQSTGGSYASQVALRLHGVVVVPRQVPATWG